MASQPQEHLVGKGLLKEVLEGSIPDAPTRDPGSQFRHHVHFELTTSPRSRPASCEFPASGIEHMVPHPGRSQSSASLSSMNSDLTMPQQILPSLAPFGRAAGRRRENDHWPPRNTSLSDSQGDLHSTASPSPHPHGKPSVKHLTCYWWKTKGSCRFSEIECLYSHHDTGKLAEAPRHVLPGQKAMAGRNLNRNLSTPYGNHHLNSVTQLHTSSPSTNERASYLSAHAPDRAESSLAGNTNEHFSDQEEGFEPLNERATRDMLSFGTDIVDADGLTMGSAKGGDENANGTPTAQASSLRSGETLKHRSTDSTASKYTTGDSSYEEILDGFQTLSAENDELRKLTASLTRDKRVYQDLLQTANKDKAFYRDLLTQANHDKDFWKQQVLCGQTTSSNMPPSSASSAEFPFSNEKIRLAVPPPLARQASLDLGPISRPKSSSFFLSSLGPKSASHVDFRTAPSLVVPRTASGTDMDGVMQLRREKDVELDDILADRYRDRPAGIRRSD